MQNLMLFLNVLATTAVLASTNEPVQLLVPDGQLKSHPIRVFLDRDITTSMNPFLTLTVSHALLNRGHQQFTTNACMFLARNQLFTLELRGNSVTKTGTLLLFDLDGNLPVPWYKAVVRVTPSLIWTESGADSANPELRIAGGDTEIYLGNAIGAVVWTSVVMVVFVGFICLICPKSAGSRIVLFCGPDGTLSLWRVQLAAWTVAVGSVVVCFGLTRLEIPAIPETLVALMGLSLATGGLGYVGNKEHLQKGQVKPAPKPFLQRLGELLYDENDQLSVAKAQMLFWTLSMLLLFLIKSFEESAVWEVPWTMVALMGVSQAGYLGPKFVKPDNSNPQPTGASPGNPTPPTPQPGA